MKSCRIVSVFAIAGFIAMSAMEACGGDLPKQQTGPISGDLPPDATAPPAITDGPTATDPKDIDVQFIHGRVQIKAPICSRVYIAAVKGTVTPPQGMLDDVLHDGDVLVVKYPDAFYVDVQDTAVRVIQPFACTMNEKDKPGALVSSRRSQYARELTWAKGQMHAHIDVTGEVSPGLYLGRLEGTANVAEHKHDASVEILAIVEASGTLTLDGKPQHIGNKQVVVIPKGTTHAWTPDPGTKLLAVQMYAPPGPEKRFMAFDDAEHDAGARDLDLDSGLPTCNPPWVVDGSGNKVMRSDCMPKDAGAKPKR